MGQQHRPAIFQMRSSTDPETGKPFSLQKIATTLGISKSLVVKELNRPATRAIEPSGNGADPLLAGSPPMASAPLPYPADDPLLDARRRLAVEQLNVQEMNLRAQRQEAERRLQLLERTPSGGDNGAMLLVLDDLRRLREQITQVQARAAAPAAPPPPAPTVLDSLGQLKQGWEAVQAIAPRPPPSDAASLELQVALDRLNLEREERMRRLDADLDERRRQLDNERIRAEAIAQQISAWGPVIAQGIQQWLLQQGNNGGGQLAAPSPPGTPNPAPAVGPRPGLTVLPPDGGGPAITVGMIEGPCPSCGIKLGIVPVQGQTERCPRCTTELAVVNGRIWPKLPAERGGSVAG